MPSPIPGPPPFATSTLAGLVSTGTQQFAGAKEFLGRVQVTGNALGLGAFTTVGMPDPALNLGALAYDTDLDLVQFSDGVAWTSLASAVGSFVSKTGDTMTGNLEIDGASLFADSGSNTLVVDSSTHRVGIRIGSPTVELDVAGAARITSTVDLWSATANTKLRIFNDATRVVGFGYQANDFRSHLHDSSDKFSWRATAAGASMMELLGGGNLTVDAGDNTFIVDAANNRVGIGTLTPSQPLTVAGVIFSSAGGFRFPDASTQTSAFVPSSYVAKVGDTMSGNLLITGANLDVDTADHTLFVNATTNRVAIGINNPARSLHIKQAVAADHLVTLENTDVEGSSGIVMADNAGTERLRIGYANPSWAGAPLADLCFIQTDSNKDLIIAHAGALAHRFFVNGNVKLDQADNVLFVDAVNNKVGLGIGTVSTNHFLDIVSSQAAKKLIRIQNTENTGFTAIEFFNQAGTAIGSIGHSNSGATPAAQFGIDTNNTFVIRNGTTVHHHFGSSGNGTLDQADGTFFLDAGNNRIGLFSASISGSIAGIGQPSLVIDSQGRTEMTVIRGDGTHRKGLTIHDATNNRSWSWDHATAANNNRHELWYWNGTAEARILTMTTNGRLGINNVTPTVELDVSGSAQISAGLVVDTDTLVVDATANAVGIGTTPAAGSTLHVDGSARFDGANRYFGVAGITAFAGGGQTDAVVLTGEVNFVDTVATDADSVKLPAALLGLKVVVFNDGAEDLAIFPAVGDEIDALGVDTAFTLIPGASKTFWGKSGALWRSM